MMIQKETVAMKEEMERKQAPIGTAPSKNGKPGNTLHYRSVLSFGSPSFTVCVIDCYDKAPGPIR